ncbi:MAG: PilZ domain-containing protein [bacterium]|nr:PilZ domain-containing protein [bacterium]
MTTQQAYLGRRRYIRIDTVLPVEFQFTDTVSGEPLTDIRQGFTRDVSKGGMCLIVRNLDKETVNLFEKTDCSILLHMDLIYRKTPIRIKGKIVASKQERFSTPNEYVLHISFTDIEKADAASLVKYAVIRKNRMPIAIASLVIVGLALAFALWRGSRIDLLMRQTEEAYAKLKNEKTVIEDKFGKSLSEKNSLESRIREFGEKINKMEKSIDDKKLAEDSKNAIEGQIEETKAAKETMERELKKVLRKKEFYEKELNILRDKFKSGDVKVTFKNNTSMVGKILSQNKDKIRLQIQYGVIDVNKSEVDNYEFITYEQKLAEETKPGKLRPYAFNDNAVWVDISWVDQSRDVEDIEKLGGIFKKLGIKNIFVKIRRDVDWLWSPEKLNYVGSFVNEMKKTNREFEFFAWVEARTEFNEDPNTDLSEESDFDNVVNAAKALCSDYVFDGVLLDLVPVPNGNENFIALIKEIKKRIPDKKAGAVTMEWGNEGDIDVWDSEYYREVSALADFIVLPCYNAYFENTDIYVAWIEEQVSTVSDISMSPLFIGVSTVKDSTDAHNAAVENMSNALVGINTAVHNKDTDPSKIRGVAVMSDWTSTAEDWKNFSSLWSKKSFLLKEKGD